jgi:hypothetical protein
MRRVILHIDRLVLRGVRVDDQRSFEAALEKELVRILNNFPTFVSTDAGGSHESLRRNHIHIPRNASAARVGKCVGQGIAEAVTR